MSSIIEHDKSENIIVIIENVITILFGLALTALGASINLKKIFNQALTNGKAYNWLDN